MKFHITLALLAAAALVSTCVGHPSQAEPRNDDWWRNKHNEFVQNTNNNRGIPIIFYGASWTEFFQNGPGNSVWNEFYAPLGAANYGIGGDQTQHVLWRIQNGEVDGLNPKLVVLGGDPCSNGFGGWGDDGDIARGIQTIINELRQRLPNTKILYLGVLPRGDNNSFWQRTLNVNSILPQFSDGFGMVYHINFFNAFTNGNGAIDAGIYEGDRLHFNTEGYRRWAANMNPVFFELIQ